MFLVRKASFQSSWLYKLHVCKEFSLLIVIKTTTFGRKCPNYHKINYAFNFVVSRLAVGYVAVETLAGFGDVSKWTLTKHCTAFLRQNGIQEDDRFTDSEATKNYCEEMKETLSLPRCSCRIEPQSGSFQLSLQGTYFVQYSWLM